MRVLWSTHGTRGDFERRMGPTVQLGRSAEVWVYAPPDFAELLAGVGAPRVPTGGWR